MGDDDERTINPSLMLQYRIRGTFSDIPTEEIRNNWVNKPYNSKIVDHYYLRFQSQSSVVGSRKQFLDGIALLQEEYPNDKEIPFPECAKGVSLKANYIEEWRGMQDRLHERYLYVLEEDQWFQQVLVP